jgi:hypothetical protein
MEMMRNLRHVNIDHLHVGWYQSTYFGSFINRPLLDSQFNYQDNIEESVVLIYGKLTWTKRACEILSSLCLHHCCHFPLFTFQSFSHKPQNKLKPNLPVITTHSADFLRKKIQYAGHI